MKTITTHQTPSTPRRSWLPAALLGLALLAVSTSASRATDNRAPEIPDEISVGVTNKVHFHGFGVGFQVYTWDGISWGRAVPDATLFDNDGNIVASHFAGPRWKSNSGSIVLGGVVQPTVTVDTNSIPWLRLKALSAEGPGVFAETTFIQRVNTVGGLPPSQSGAFIGQVAKSPYTADYFFYRASQN